MDGGTMSVTVADLHTATSSLTWHRLRVTRPLHLGSRGFEARVESGELQNRSRRVRVRNIRFDHHAKMVIEASEVMTTCEMNCRADDKRL
jgi:hypothetical protein